MTRILLAAALSLVVYGLVFGALVHRPLTRGVIFDMLEAKLDHLATQTGPQIVVVAGSNARFSHSCAVLSDRLDRPCTNMGIAAGVGMDTILGAVADRLEPGDLVYLPLEYGQYGLGQKALLTSAETGEMLRRDPAGLIERRGAEGFVRAFFGFDLSDAVQGALEMGFQAMGGRRRFGVETLNAMGDETGHTAEKGATYRGVLAAATLGLPAPDRLTGRDPDSGASPVIARFVADARTRGARIVGGLPTTPDTHAVPDELIAAITAFWHGHGAEMIVLENRSAYPLSDFYDTVYHLNQTAAARHSAALATALQALPDGG